jgi:nitroimidazol reductase NimA-like FMN-containing flavoprotein (pyridoxamine 5'-phosphate oxidase superfamily)
MDNADASALLREGTFGVLSLTDADGAPYGVPLNYAFLEDEGTLLFHCARTGRKLDCIRHESRVAFTVVGRWDVDAPRFTTRYSSVIVQGRASFVETEDELRKRLLQLCEALAPGQARTEEVIEKYLPRVAVVRVDIESISGKANRGGDE